MLDKSLLIYLFHFDFYIIIFQLPSPMLCGYEILQKLNWKLRVMKRKVLKLLNWRIFIVHTIEHG